MAAPEIPLDLPSCLLMHRSGGPEVVIGAGELRRRNVLTNESVITPAGTLFRSPPRRCSSSCWTRRHSRVRAQPEPLLL